MSLPTKQLTEPLEARLTYPLKGGAAASTYAGASAVIAAEAILWHLYFVAKMPVAAWVLTSLNAAALTSIWLGYRAVSRPKIVLHRDGIDVSVFRRKPLRISWSNIERAEPATWQSEPDPMLARDYINSSSPFVPNILITLRSPLEIRYLPGVSKAVRIVGIRVERAEEVLAALSARLEPLESEAR